MTVWYSVRVYDRAGRLIDSTILFAPDGAPQARAKALDLVAGASRVNLYPCTVAGHPLGDST